MSETHSTPPHKRGRFFRVNFSREMGFGGKKKSPYANHVRAKKICYLLDEIEKFQVVVRRTCLEHHVASCIGHILILAEILMGCKIVCHIALRTDRP